MICLLWSLCKEIIDFLTVGPPSGLQNKQKLAGRLREGQLWSRLSMAVLREAALR